MGIDRRRAVECPGDLGGIQMALTKSNEPAGEKMTREEKAVRAVKGEACLGLFSEDLTLPLFMILASDSFVYLELNKHYPCKGRSKTARSPDLPPKDENGDPEDDIIAPAGYIFCEAKYMGKNMHQMMQCYNCSIIHSDQGKCKTNMERHIRYGTYEKDLEHLTECANTVSTKRIPSESVNKAVGAGTAVEGVTEGVKKKKGKLASLKDALKEDAKKAVESENAKAKEKVNEKLGLEDIEVPRVPEGPKVDTSGIETPDIPDIPTTQKTMDPSSFSDEELAKLVQELLKRQGKQQ